ncbi:MAG: ABC transporter permease [Chloroflexi bacterium]|nr:ABC transporter permease [Chloroflexota bacterium]
MLSIIFLGVVLATVVLASTPIFIGALERVGLDRAIDKQLYTETDIDVLISYVPLEHSQIDKFEALIGNGIQEHVPDLVIGKNRYLLGPTIQVKLPRRRTATGEPINMGVFQSFSGFEQHVRLLAGEMPSQEVVRRGGEMQMQAAISKDGADLFSLGVGDVIGLLPAGTSKKEVLITGVVEPIDPTERYWHGYGSVFFSPISFSENQDPPLALLVAEDALIEGIGRAYPENAIGALWLIDAKREIIKERPISSTLASLEAFDKAITKTVSRSVVSTGTVGLLKDFQNRLFFSRIPLLLLVALMLAIVLYYLVMMAFYLIQRRQEELSLLRSRGIGRWHLFRFYLLEGFLLTGVAVIISPFLALGLVAILGELPFFQGFTGGHLFPVELNMMPFLASLGGGAISLIAIMVPLLIGSRSGLAAHKQLAARPPQSPFFQRYYVDVGLLIVGGLVFWELRARGTLVSGGIFGSRTVNEALLFAPFILLVAVTLIFLRLFPLVARVLSRTFSRIAPAWIALGIWHMSRNPMQYSWLILLLVMVTGLGTLATTMGGTLEKSYRERILYKTPTDIRVEEIPGFGNTSTTGIREGYARIPGVTSLSLAYRGSGYAGTTIQGYNFTILAVEPKDFRKMAWYRDDFSKKPLSSVMETLQTKVSSPPIILPQRASRIGVWVKPGDEYKTIYFWAIVRDSRGKSYTVSLGPLGSKEWHLLEEDLPGDGVSPFTLEALQIYESVRGASGTPGHIYLDGVQVKIPSQPQPIEVEGFERLGSWLPQATSALSNDNLVLSNKEVHNGRASALFSWGKTVEQGVRGIYRSPIGGPLPVVASTSFLGNTGKKVGDSVMVTFLGKLIPVEVRDSVEYFPTLDPSKGGFLLADLNALLSYTNLLSFFGSTSPNEVFLSAAPKAEKMVVSFLDSQAGINKIHDRRAELEEILLDPLVTAGWKGMVFISLGLIAVIAAMGYLTYLLGFSKQRRGEMAFLQAIGFSRQQFLGLLALEHLIVVTIGLGLGTWTGLRMSSLAVSSLSHTETGGVVLPPLILVTQWGYLVLIYAILMLVVFDTLLLLNRIISRLSLHEISRLEV